MQKKRNFTLSTFKKVPISKWFIFALLTLITILYVSLFNNALTNWDDRVYITDNPYLKNLSFENLKNIFTSYYTGNYHPLTLLSLTIDYKIGGIGPWPYQLTNLILHLGNTLLVYIFIKSLIPLNSSDPVKFSIVPLIAATLFGIHTLQVESVAWISERKNVLYAFFFLASLILYLKYLRTNTYKAYTLSISFFLLSLLSKGMAVPLLLCIIAIDYFTGRDLFSKKVILEKIPFVALSMVFGLIAIIAQRSLGAIQSETHYSWLSHIAVACYGFIQYLLKLCIPYQLSAYYPYPVKSGMYFPFQYYASIALLSFFLIILWRYFRQNKAVVFGVLFFIANISIVLQLLPVGDAIMADRYVYVASIGFFFILGYYGNRLWQKRIVYRKGVIVALSLFCILLGVKTYQRIGIWKDSFTLWNDVLRNYPDNNARGYLNRGALYYEMGNNSEASKDFERLLKLDPYNATAHKGLGLIKLKSGIAKHGMQDAEGAMNDYDASLALYKSYDGYYNRGVLRMNMHNFEGALADFENAVKIDSLVPDAFINKGFIDYQTGHFTEALRNYNRALLIDPKDNRAYLGRGITKIKLGSKLEGCKDLKQALAMGNTEAEAEIQKNCN